MNTLNKKLIFAYLYDRNYKPFCNEDLKKIDVINYSFGLIKDGRLTIDHLLNFQTVKNQACYLGVKVVLAIGGWGADGFSQACSSYETRKVFIDSIIDTIKEHELDGIDIDWEYPTSNAGGISTIVEDKVNFTLFIKELRLEMNKINRNLILSAAVGGGEYATRYYEVDKLSLYLDYIHLMTYDLLDYNSLITSHHTNIYGSPNGYSSVDQTVKAYVNKGADIKRLVIGIAFYGHIGNVSNSINGMKVKSDNITNSISYTNIVNKYLNNPDFIYYYDEVAKASWLCDGNTFITFDDQKSICEKVNYVKQCDLAGVMFWEINHDTTNKLINAIFNEINYE